MSLASIFFFVSLAGMIFLAVSKWIAEKSGRPSTLSRFLSRYDGRLASFLTTLSALVRRVLLASLRFSSTMVHRAHMFLTVYLHRLLLIAERRMRAWREVAREKKIERGVASLFIKDVAEYKSQLRQDNPRF